MSACKECMERNLKLAKDTIKLDNIEIEDVYFENQLTTLTKKSKTVLVTPIKVKYRRKKNDGTPYKNSSFRTVNILGSYCQFCGKALEKLD